MFGAEGLSEVGEILFICSVLILFIRGTIVVEKGDPPSELWLWLYKKTL